MASAAQIIANQSNAQSSTGPRTPEGKAAVAQNALTHGFTSKQYVILPEQQQEFDFLHQSLFAELDPQGAIEMVTYQDLLRAAWNLERLRGLEARIWTGDPDDLSNPETTTKLDRLDRYQSRTQNAYYKALRELRTLQTNRALRDVKLAEDEQPDVPAITDINQLTKQTHSEVTAAAIKQAITMLDLESGVLNLHARQAYEAHSAAAPSPVAAARPVAVPRAPMTDAEKALRL